MTIYLILITVAVSFLAFNSEKFFNKSLFHPYTIKRQNQFYRYLSSGFIHADYLHLIFNMIVLYSFGRSVEMLYTRYYGEGMGTLLFLALYIGGIIISSIPSHLKHQDNPNFSSVGASGGVSAILFAVIFFKPIDNFYLFGIFGIPALVFGIAFLLISIRLSRLSRGNINHDAHIAGSIYGFFFTFFLNPKLILIFFQQIGNGIQQLLSQIS